MTDPTLSIPFSGLLVVLLAMWLIGIGSGLLVVLLAEAHK